MHNANSYAAAISLFLLTMLGGASINVIVRLLDTIYAGYSAFQLVFIANAIAAALCFLLRTMRGQSMRPASHFLWLRAILEFGSFSAVFYSVTLLPLPMHTALLFMTPIFGTAFAAWFLGEHATRMTYATLAFSLVGMLIITQPWQDDVARWGDIRFALLAAVGFAICGSMIKRLTRDTTPRAIAFHMLWMTSLCALPFALANWQPLEAAHLPYLGMIGLLSFIIQHTVGMALARLPLMSVIPLNFVQLLIVSLLAWLLFGEVISQSTALGAAIILTAMIANIWYAARHTRDMAANEDMAQTR